MNVSSLGEFGLIQRITQRILKGQHLSLDPGVIGIGDDCAVIPQDEKHSLIITTDMLIEDVHFLTRAISPRDLGHKSLAVNLSDIAAMGGQPKSAFLSIGVVPETEVKWMDSFFEGFATLAEEFDVRLLGGDTTRSPKSMVINVSVIGKIRSDRVKLRSAAKPGDFICVTGNLGDSAAGLKAILEQQNVDSDIGFLIERHCRPHPHLHQGTWLAQHPDVHAMMDVSDGINSDIRRIMEQSRCGAVIHLEALPISSQLKAVRERFNWDAFGLVTSGGEDYCLLVTVDSTAYEQLAHDYNQEFGFPLFRIGEITDQIEKLSYLMSGELTQLNTQDFEHFPNLRDHGDQNGR